MCCGRTPPKASTSWRRLRATEQLHLPISGYGVKAYTLSMITVAVTVTNGEVPASLLGDIVERGLDMLTEPVRLLDGVPGGAGRGRP